MPDQNKGTFRTYGPIARTLHWIMAVLVLLQVAFGIVMTYDGPEPNLWTTLAETLGLYDLHKLLGVILLALVAVRLANRILREPPPEDPTLAPWQRAMAALVHAWIYLLLIVVPVLGWVGVSLYPALNLFGSIPLPALAEPNRAASEPVLVAHAIAAFVLVGLVLAHVAAALFHHLVRRDDTLRRMLPPR